MPRQGANLTPKPPDRRSAKPLPHVPGRAAWLTGQHGITRLHVDATCCFCGRRHAHVAAGPRMAGCRRGVYVVDVPVADLVGAGGGL